MKKIINILLIVLGIVLIVFGSSQIFNKKTKELKKESPQELKIKEGFSKLIKDFTVKNSVADSLNEKYKTNEFSSTNLPFSKDSMLNFGLELAPDKDLETCFKLVEENLELVHQSYLKNLDYKLEIDDVNEALNIRIKSMFLLSYISEVSDITFKFMDVNTASHKEAFQARCLVLKGMKDLLHRYENKEYNTNLRVKYRLVDNQLYLDTYIPLLSALENIPDPVEITGKSREENIKEIYDIIK